MSTDEIFFDGIRYISAVAAAQESNLTRDYIARLCREGKIKAKRLGKIWYVEHPTLQSFLLEHRFALNRKYKELAEQRAREYGAGINSARSPLENPLSSQRKAEVQKTQPADFHDHSNVLALKKFPVGAKEQMMRALATKTPAIPIGLSDAALRLAAHAPRLQVSIPDLVPLSP